MPIFSITGKRPPNLGAKSDGRLAPCPKSPNCVCSDCEGPRHGIAAISLGDLAPEKGWELIRGAVLNWPRTEIVEESDGYLHAECRSAFWGFADDLELHLRADQGEVAVRSASRLGYSDFGVNRRRVEKIRAEIGNG